MADPRKRSGPGPESKDLVVFSILRESACSACGEPLGKGSLLLMENQQPLCLECADLDHLVYLPAGAPALTRRARKYSALSAVVVRFSRSRGRYERQGLLVEEAAVKQAEEECFSDAEVRAARQQRAAEKRVVEDHAYTIRIAEALRELFPGCPPAEARSIAEHATVRGSGRVGRTAAAKELDEGKLTAAAVAAIRHRHTRYDELLMMGHDRRDARDAVRGDLDRVLERWRSPS